MSQQLEFGRMFRDEGIATVINHTPLSYRAHFSAAVLALARKQSPFTAEDVRDQVGDPPNHVNALPGLIQAEVRTGLIKKIGYVQAKRPTSHARMIGLYLGT